MILIRGDAKQVLDCKAKQEVARLQVRREKGRGRGIRDRERRRESDAIGNVTRAYRAKRQKGQSGECPLSPRGLNTQSGND